MVTTTRLVDSKAQDGRAVLLFLSKDEVKPSSRPVRSETRVAVNIHPRGMRVGSSALAMVVANLPLANARFEDG